MKTISKAVVVERNHIAMVMKERNLLAKLHCPQLVNMHVGSTRYTREFVVLCIKLRQRASTVSYTSGLLS